MMSDAAGQERQQQEQVAIPKLRRFVKVPNTYPTYTKETTADTLLKQIDSKNFAVIDSELLKRINNVKQPRQFLKPIRSKKEAIKIRNTENTPTKQKLTNKSSTSSQNSVSESIDLGLKKIIVERKLANSSNYSLRAMRKKITASNEEGGERNNSESNSNWERPVSNNRNGKKPSRSSNDDMDWVDSLLPSTSKVSSNTVKKPPKRKFLKVQAPSRKVLYGWYTAVEPEELKVAREGDDDWVLRDPDERTCFNERMVWAGQFVLCPGQTNLCKLL